MICHADQARKLVKDNEISQLNFQRSELLSRIEREAKLGKTHIIINPLMESGPYSIRLDAEDYEFFRKRGFSVLEVEKKVIKPYEPLPDYRRGQGDSYDYIIIPGMISWK